MYYDRAMLKSWAEMETWDQYLERNGALNQYSSKEGFAYLAKEYFEEVKKRIRYCKKLLAAHDESCVYYTLAELYNRCNLDESPTYLYKCPVRYYCIKAIRKNPEYAPLWLLLAESYAWVATLGGESKNTMPSLQTMVEQSITVDIEQNDPQVRKKLTWFIKMAVKCSKKALALEPENKKCQRLNRECYRLIAETFKPDRRIRAEVILDTGF